MCVDFTNLNAAYPKDLRLLPYIDHLIDGSSGNHMLSLINAYLVYNQIRMDPLDAPKTTFMFNHGNHYYNVIPFGLKNAGATYQ